MELLGAFGGGLLFIGIGVLVFDFFAARLIKKIYPDPEYWNEELNFRTLSPKDQKTFSKRKRLYQDAISHRFRRIGIIICLIGVCLLAISGAVEFIHI